MLPLPSNKVRDLSLQQHLALTVARKGDANEVQLAILTKTVCLSYFLMDASAQKRNLASLRQAVRALNRCLQRLTSHQQANLSDDELQVIEAIVKLHDTQLEIMPSYRYTEAWNRMQHHFASYALAFTAGTDI